MSEATIAVIGLGLMGSRMAANLGKAGFGLRGFDVDPSRLEEFAARGGSPLDSPAAAVEGCEAALLSLPTSEVSIEVCLGEAGLATSGSKGLHVYDTTTGRPEDAIALSSALAEVGIDYADTTVSGNGQVAEEGNLVVMMGGSDEAYQIGIPIFEAIGRSHHHVGPSGAGSRMKLVVNHVLGIHRLALAEGLVVAEKAGMDLDVTLAVLKDGLAYSRAMELWGERMIEGDHEIPFSRLRQSHKDARLILDHGRSLEAPVELISVVEAALSEGEAGGLADVDNSAVIEVLRRRAGIGKMS